MIARLGGEKRSNLGNSFDFRRKMNAPGKATGSSSGSGSSGGNSEDSSDISRLNRSLNSGKKSISKLLYKKKGRK